MNLNWEEDLRRHKRRVRARWAAGILVVMLLGIPVGMALTQHRGARSAALNTLPGFRGGERPVDTAPFTTFAPQDDGSTTIPGGPAGNDDQDPGLTAPITTSTLPPAVSVPASDNVCSAVNQVSEIYRISGRMASTPADFAVVTAERLDEAARLLRATNDRRYEPAAALFAKAASDLKGATSLDQVLAVIKPIVTASTPEIQQAALPLQQHAASACSPLAGAAPSPS